MVNFDKLQALAESLKAKPPGSVNMRYFKKEGPGCGTVACALGWYIIDNKTEATFSEVLNQSNGVIEHMIDYGGYANAPWEFAADEFGITASEASCLFANRADIEERRREVTEAFPDIDDEYLDHEIGRTSENDLDYALIKTHGHEWYAKLTEAEVYAERLGALVEKHEMLSA